MISTLYYTLILPTNYGEEMRGTITMHGRYETRARDNLENTDEDKKTA